MVAPNGRLARALQLANEPLPSVPPLSNHPSEAEQIAAWRQHAANYATLALTLREVIPTLLQSLEDIASGLHSFRVEMREDIRNIRRDITAMRTDFTPVAVDAED